MARPGAPLTWLWAPAALVALAWPARLAGPLDGVPLDRVFNAAVIGLIAPALALARPRFTRSRLARGCILALVAWKLLLAAVVVQDGLCVRFTPASPLVAGATGAPHSWDIRADWRSADPACSAVMTRGYQQLADFPVWFFNLSPLVGNQPAAADRPPGTTLHMTVSGYLRVPASGRLTIDTSDVQAVTVSVDGAEVSRQMLAAAGMPLVAGIHHLRADVTFTGNEWRFVPLWNGGEIFQREMATLKHPSAVDLMIRPWARWITAALALVLTCAWAWSFLARIADADVMAWTVGASTVLGLLAATGTGEAANWAVAGLFGALALPVSARLRSTRGAFCLLGVPWLTMVAVATAGSVGHFTLYTAGDDWWTFQRYAYRIVMQGYWLEGGSPTFWFQPLYRWIAGLLHVVFGDSSVGEAYWDAACVLAMALFSYRVTRGFAGFRWGLAAGALTLAVFVESNAGIYLGKGLSEISSSGLMAMAALLALRSRGRRWPAALAAGVLAVLAFYTRLNNLPMVAAIVAFAAGVRQPIGSIWQPSSWQRRVWRPTVGIVLGCLAAAVALLAWRTWHYTGVFSVFYGTQRDHLAIWHQGMSLREWIGAVIESIFMVVTVNDPPRFDARAATVIAGAAAAVLGAARIPRLREVPAAPALMVVAALSSAALARGTAYAGRFSIHMIAVTSILATCAVASAWRRGSGVSGLRDSAGNARMATSNALPGTR